MSTWAFSTSGCLVSSSLRACSVGESRTARQEDGNRQSADRDGDSLLDSLFLISTIKPSLTKRYFSLLRSEKKNKIIGEKIGRRCRFVRDGGGPRLPAAAHGPRCHPDLRRNRRDSAVRDSQRARRLSAEHVQTQQD